MSLHGRVTLAEALRLLREAGDQIGQSSLSRYVAQHADALKPEKRGRRTLVDFEALFQHRAENIRLEAVPVSAPKERPQPASTRANEAARKLRADAQMRELDLAERRGELVIKCEVEEAASTAVSALRQAFELACDDTAETLAAALGVEARLIRPHIKAFQRKGIEAFVRALADYQLVETHRDAAPPKSENGE